MDVAPAVEPDPHARRAAPPARRRRRWPWAVAAVALAVVLFVGVTAATGLPGPGPLRRYPVATLQDLASAVHAEAGPLRTPDDCWRTTFRARRDAAPDGPSRPIARVDWLRSRVVVRAYADQVGRVDPRTADTIRRRVRAVVADDDRFDPDMVVVEPSPDGWSPLMSCDLVTRGWL